MDDLKARKGGTSKNTVHRNHWSNYESGAEWLNSFSESWKSSGSIDDDPYFFLLASFLESADKVANTASVYGAYLKHIKRSAAKTMIIQPALIEKDLFSQDSPLQKSRFSKRNAKRWYNFWSARALEQIFSENEKITPVGEVKYGK